MLNSHIEDGVALTKFLYWIKKSEINKLTEKDVESKLESYRKKIKIIYILVLILLLALDQMVLSFITNLLKILIEN